MKKVVFALGFICISACQKKLTLTQYQWSARDSKSLPEIQSNLFANPDSTIKIYDEIVEQSQQRIGGAIVESTYQQKVSSTDGKLQYLRAQFENKSFASLAPQAEKLRTLRFSALEVMKRKHLGLKYAQHIFDPEVIISGSEENPKLQYQFEFIPKNGGGAYSMRVSPSYAIESIERVDHCFQESRSMVFPSGPKLSELVETLLTTLMGDGTLSSPQIIVSSADGKKALAEHGEFVYSTDDERFDHVQVFFFTQKVLNYARTNWDFNLPFTLRIGLKSGFPIQTIDMYYHKAYIGLGDGNGTSYRNIPRDPSIVTHEVSHAIIDAISGMSNEDGSAPLNEGFADYLTASIWEIPELAHSAYVKAPFQRTVDNKLLYTEKNGGTYHDSGILSGTFWEIEKKLGRKKAQMLALKTIVRLGKAPTLETVFPAVLDAAQAAQLTETELAMVREVFINRAWPH